MSQAPRWSLAPVAAVAILLVAIAPAHAQSHADRRPLVRLLVDRATRAESAPALVRAELEASGFAVEVRHVPASVSSARESSSRRAAPLFAEVGFGRADGRATADVQVFALDGSRGLARRVDVGELPSRSQGRRTRVLVTLAVRVGELLRARAGLANAAAGTGDVPRSAPSSPVPPPATARPALSIPPPPPPEGSAGTLPAPSSPPPAAAAPPALAPAIPAVTGAPPPLVAASDPAPLPEPPRADRPAASVTAPRPAPPAASAAAPRAAGLQLEAGLAVGQSVTEAGLAAGPVLRVAWLDSSGLLARATVATLVLAGSLSSPAGDQASLIQTLGLAQVGYQGRLWRGRVTPEATLGVGAQHVLASGHVAVGPVAAPPSRDSVIAFAVSAGGGFGLRLSRALTLVVNADLFRAIPRPVVLVPGRADGQAVEVAIGRGAPISFLASTALKLAL